MDKSEPTNNSLAYTRNVVSLLKKAVSFRPLAYTSEVGEAFRPIIPNWLVKSGYGLSIGYVIGDICLKVHELKNENENKEIMYNKMKMKAIDLSIWHTFASIILPAVTIHTIVKSSTKSINFVAKSVVLPKFIPMVVPTIIGLCSIPFIIHPLDDVTDYMMDNSVRKLYELKE